MIVEGNFFENGIAFFTRLVNTSISVRIALRDPRTQPRRRKLTPALLVDLFLPSSQWVCSNGDVGCFVGHNAFIRWSALQEIAQWKEDEKRWQIWSESHVSEGQSQIYRSDTSFGLRDCLY